MLTRIVVFSCLAILIVKLAFLPYNNMVTGDEAMYTSPAWNIITKGRPSVEEYPDICAYGEDFFFAGRLFLAAQLPFYALFGYTPFVIKLVPFIFYIIAGLCLYRLVFRLASGHPDIRERAAAIAVALWFLMPTYLYRFIARPESMQLCFMLIAVNYFLKVTAEGKASTSSLFAAGLLSCIGMWIHPTTFFVGAIPVAIMALITLRLRQTFAVISGQIAMGVLFSLLYALPNLNGFWTQFYEAGIVWMDNDLLVSEGAVAYRVQRELEKLAGFFGRPYVLPFTLLFVAALFATNRRFKDMYLKYWIAFIPGPVIASVISAHSAASFFYYAYLLPACVIAISFFFAVHWRRKPVLAIFMLACAYFIGTQLAVTYLRRDAGFTELNGRISRRIDNGAVIMGTEPHNILLKSDKFIGSVYYTFWVASRRHQNLINKYRCVYGDSFIEFLRRKGVKYVILDRNNQDCEEIEVEIAPYGKVVFDEESEYGMWDNGRVKVYRLDL